MNASAPAISDAEVERIRAAGKLLTAAWLSWLPQLT
jgi:hypothetical protein